MTDCTRLFELMEVSNNSPSLTICRNQGRFCIKLKIDGGDYYVYSTKEAEDVLENRLKFDLKSLEVAQHNADLRISRIKKALQLNVEP